MVYLSTVHTDPPLSSGLFLASWAQPFRASEDGLAWFVTTGGVARQVQRDRLTDRVYWCHVLVVAGTTSFDVETGPSTSPATAWTAPTLTGLKMRHYGQDESRHSAALDGTDGANVDDILRDGHLIRTVRRWVRSRVDQVGTGAVPDAIGTQSFGHHLYFEARADWPGVVRAEIVLTNATATMRAQGNGIEGMFGHAYLTGSELVLPAGWAVLVERTMPEPLSGQHVFPSKMGTVRRYVLYQTADPLNAGRAADVAERRGWGLAREGRSYLHEPSFLPIETILPDLELGYSYAGTPGYAGAEIHAAGRLATVRSIVAAGSSGAENIISPRLGYFHPLGSIPMDDVGGTDIDTHCGVEAVRSNLLLELLRGDMKIDSSGVWLLHEDTGRPFRTHEFGDAYTTPGTIPNYDSNPAYLGRQPFSFNGQNNAGYEIGSTDTSYFIGWWPPPWPPHFHDTRGNRPDGSFNQTFDKYVPIYPPASWGTPPHSLNRGPGTSLGVCTYEIGNLRSGYYDWPDAPGFYGRALGYRDPEDFQHFIRMSTRAKLCAWLGGDLISIDWIDMLAEWAAYTWSEVGHVPYLYYQPPNFRSLLVKWQAVQANPHVAAVYCGRESGWVADTFAAQCHLVSPTRRDVGYPTRGIKRRCEMMLEVLHLTALEDGVTYRLPNSAGGGAGQLIEAWQPAAGGNSGPPIPTRFSIMQVGLEMPIVMAGMFGLGRVLGRTNEIAPTILNAIRAHTGATAYYVVSQYNGTEWGPAKYAAVWDDILNLPVLTALRDRAFDGTGNPGHPNHTVMLELGYRLSGQTAILDVSMLLGFRPPPGTTRAQRGAGLLGSGFWAFMAGLIGYLLNQAGPDTIDTTPPEVTELSGVIESTFLMGGTPELAPPLPPIDPPPIDPPPVDPPVDPPPPVEPPDPTAPPSNLPLTLGQSGEPPLPDYTVTGANPFGPNALLVWSHDGGTFRVVAGDLARESGLASAVLISLFADRRVEADPARPLEFQDLRGWWGELEGDPFGSRLWTLSREKQTPETLARAREAADEALAWLKRENIARAVDVEASYPQRGVLGITCTISRGSSRRWAHLWQGVTGFEMRVGDVALRVVAP